METRLPWHTTRGGVIGGFFPVFRKKYLLFQAFSGFFSHFPVSATFRCLFGLFRLSAASKRTFLVSVNFKLCFLVSTIFSNFSGFPWLKNVIFRFPAQMLIPFFLRTFLFFFLVFRDFFKAFPAFRQKYYRPSNNIMPFMALLSEMLV